MARAVVRFRVRGYRPGSRGGARGEAGSVGIAVMNWVWTNSPTSGNERLVLLALPDACSREDGTGCWPSAATIARKANISDRTVRRVIALLEAEGHVMVHRGGGRAGTTNSCTVVTDIHSPGQNVTLDNLSGSDTAARPPLTQPCQRTPDPAVSPDPPKNYQITAATSAREAEARADETPAEDGTADVAWFFNRLAARSLRWLLTTGQRKRLAPAVATALAAGWTPGGLAEFAGRTPTGSATPLPCWRPSSRRPSCRHHLRFSGHHGAASAIGPPGCSTTTATRHARALAARGLARPTPTSAPDRSARSW
jgi:Helix-turn-helix domain